MPPRVTYWTGTWDPVKEAISKEVVALRIGSRARAPVVSFSPGQPNRLVRKDRVLTLSGGAWMFLRDRNKMKDDSEENNDIEFESSEDVMDAIIALDDLHRAKKISDEAYQKRRAELKDILKEIM